LRERNREDSADIDKLNLQVEVKGKESVELASKIRTIEYDISKSLGRIEDLNRMMEDKTFALKNKEAALVDAESELYKLKGQQASF
jgi:hypothetical protein